MGRGKYQEAHSIKAIFYVIALADLEAKGQYLYGPKHSSI